VELVPCGETKELTLSHRSQIPAPVLQFQNEIQRVTSTMLDQLPDLSETAKLEVLRLMNGAVGEAEARILRNKAS
jgi:hypothetical protein